MDPFETTTPTTLPALAPAKARGPKAIWGELLGKQFCPVSLYFLHNLHRLGPPGGAGLNPTETGVLLQIVSHKWGTEAPYPSLHTIAERMGLDVRSVRRAVKSLEGLGLLRRERRMLGGTNRYHIDGLVQRLEQLMQQDVEATDAREVAA